MRWSAACALAAILVLRTRHNATLVPKVAALAARESDNAVRKHYERALQQLIATPSPRAITGDVKLKEALQRHWGD